MIRGSKTEINPKVAYRWTEKKIKEDIPLEYIQKNAKEYGVLTSMTTMDPVRNTMWEYLFFVDSSVFSPAAAAFKQSELDNKGTKKKAKYCPYLKGTKLYREFWDEERRRCKEGYEPIVDGKPCGIRISGEYYFYLNYCRIQLTGIDPETGEDTELEDFPRFCSMDFYYFLELEARENPQIYGLPKSYKRHICLAKSRRKGFSFKNAAGATHKYTFYKKVKVAIVSERGEKAIETFEKCLKNIDFLTENTEFGGPTIYRQFSKSQSKGAIKAGVKTREGTEKGRQTEIYTVSLHHNEDKASGAGCVRVIFEEAGMIVKLKNAWAFTEPTLRSGKILKGIGIIFGTGGDMDGATQDFHDIFYDAESYKVGGYKNIYEEIESQAKVGLFIDDMWFREGAYFDHPTKGRIEAVDKQGNANRWVAEIDLNMERMSQAKRDKESYNVEVTQYCKTPSEAFLVVEGNVFPTAELNERYNQLIAKNDYQYLATPGELVQVAPGEVEFRADTEGKLKPITRYPLKMDDKDREGCVVQYQRPRRINGRIPDDTYIISIDPIGIDDDGGVSLIAIYCIKTSKHAFEIGHDEIVMSYVGRAKVNPIDTGNFILLKMAMYYNAKVTHENDRSGKLVRDFFNKTGNFDMLLKPPADIVDQHLKGPSRTNQRKSGHSMGNDKLKELGEMVLSSWLLEHRGVNQATGKLETNLDKICDPALLRELIMYRRDRNCDRVLALMGAVIQMRQLHNQYVKQESNVVNYSDYAMDFFRKKNLSKYSDKKFYRHNAKTLSQTESSSHQENENLASRLG